MIDINFDSLLRTEAFLNNLDVRLRDHRRFWTDFVAPFTYAEIDDIFDTGGRGLWSDVDPIYAAQKSLSFPGKGILRREETYFEAATTGRHPGSVAEVGPTALVLGVSGAYFESTFGANYPGIHEEGSTRTNLPARPVYALIEAGERFEERIGHLGERWQRSEIAAAERGF